MTEMSTREVLQKTRKGTEELRTRLHGLGPRLRQLLILIDGKRDTAELARLLPGPEFAQQLARLGHDGFVTRPADAPIGPDPARVVQPAPAVEDLRTLSARVTRALLDTMGPNGDDIAIRVERARSIDELRSLLPAVLSVIEACAGRAGVDGFLPRCGAV